MTIEHTFFVVVFIVGVCMLVSLKVAYNWLRKELLSRKVSEIESEVAILKKDIARLKGRVENT